MKLSLSLGALVLFFSSCQHKSVHSTGKKEERMQPSVAVGFERYVLRSQPIQKLPSGEDLNWGGFSALRFVEREPTGDLLFWTLTDRGPNGEEFKRNGWAYRGFLAPDFHPSLVKLRANKAEKSLEVVESIPMKNKTGEFLNGLPPENLNQTEAKYEIAVTSNDQEISNPAFGIDSESLAIDDKKHFWVGEEYRPSILEFDAQGTLLAAIKPSAKPNSKLRKDEIPYQYSLRKSNRGFEALAYFQNHIFFMSQSPLSYETKPKFIRIGVFDTVSRHYVAEYLYPLENSKIDKIGDMQMIDSKHFLVIEQNGEVGPGGTHLVYRVDLTSATNVLKAKFKKAPELTSMRDFPSRFQFAQKKIVLDLVNEGYSDFEKVEGLAILDSESIAVINDNDFGVEGKKVVLRPTVLGVFKIKD